MSFLKKISSIFNSNKNSVSVQTIDHSIEKAIEKTDNQYDLKMNSVKLNNVINPDELSAEEILMLSVYKERIRESEHFSGYWFHSYNVEPSQLFNGLNQKGYYDLIESIESTLESNTVEELKSILRENKLKVSGLKQDLINRILNELPEEKLNEIKLIPFYSINEKGQKAIEENPHIMFFHHSPLDISIYTAHDYKKKFPNLTPIEIAYELSTIKAEKYIKEGNWGLYRNLKYGLSVAEKNAQNFENALVLLFEVCYIDLSGMDNNFSLEKDLLEIKEEYFFPYENSLHTIAPGIVNDIRKIKVKFNMSDLHLEEHFLTSLKDYQLPFHLFTKEEAAKVLIAEINHNQEHLKKIYKVAEKRYFNKN